MKAKVYLCGFMALCCAPMQGWTEENFTLLQIQWSPRTLLEDGKFVRATDIRSDDSGYSGHSTTFNDGLSLRGHYAYGYLAGNFHLDGNNPTTQDQAHFNSISAGFSLRDSGPLEQPFSHYLVFAAGVGGADIDFGDRQKHAQQRFFGEVNAELGVTLAPHFTLGAGLLFRDLNIAQEIADAQLHLNDDSAMAYSFNAYLTAGLAF